jgi:MoaA/NifB/PqqE/SkfB family radical SAM enzyme
MWLHVEVTSRCNAWCPSCVRNKSGYGLADFVPQDLDPTILKQTIDIHKITQVQMCGNLGDPCAAKNIDQHLDLCVDMDQLQIHTNGSLRRPEWWAELARRFAHLTKFDVWFALDGLADTHSYYRQGTDWNRVIENAQAFIEAGGSAVWQFIPFKHNQHQVMDCIRMSQQLGFKRFELVKNARYKSKAYHYQTGKELAIEPWEQDKRFNRVHTIKNFVDTEKCMHLSIPSVFLNAEGVVSPCCYMDGMDISKIDIKTEFSNNSYRELCLKNCG